MRNYLKMGKREDFSPFSIKTFFFLGGGGGLGGGL